MTKQVSAGLIFLSVLAVTTPAFAGKMSYPVTPATPQDDEAAFLATIPDAKPNPPLQVESVSDPLEDLLKTLPRAKRQSAVISTGVIVALGLAVGLLLVALNLHSGKLVAWTKAAAAFFRAHAGIIAGLLLISFGATFQKSDLRGDETLVYFFVTLIKWGGACLLYKPALKTLAEVLHPTRSNTTASKEQRPEG